MEITTQKEQMEVIKIQMKKASITILTWILMIMVISGCSLVEDVNNSIDYIPAATNYINKMSTFANEIPPLIEQAATDPSALQQLNTKLTEVQKEVEAFNKLTPPSYAQDIHNQILHHNQQLETILDTYTAGTQNGQLDPSILQNQDLIQQIEALTNMLNQLQSLGQ
jgi:hypothetical protein